MENHEIKNFVDNLITQSNKIQESLLETTIYSNGSISLDILYNIPIEQVDKIQKIISKKIKQDRNIKESKLL